MSARKLKLYTHDQAAKFLGIDRATLFRWRQRGWISFCKRGRWVRYTQEDLESSAIGSRIKADGHPPSRVRTGDLKG